jgi:ubiquinone/menaquinone biosynthesis C-methylase UbiE
MSGRDAFSQFEYDSWQRVAGKYESAWSSLTRQFIPHLLDATRVTRGSRLLDVACGPGYAAEIASASGAVSTGIDFSPEMIHLAQARNPDIVFCTGDAQDLAFKDKSFDAVVMNFGALHLARPRAAFAEARRVLQPRGHYGFTVWAPPEHSPGARIFEQAVKAHADPDVALPSGPDYFGFGGAEDYRKMLGELGFDPASLDFRTVTAVWEVPSAAFVFEAERDAGVRMAAVLAAQKPDVQKAIQAHIVRELQPFATRNGLAIPYAAHVVAAGVA